MRSLRSSLIAAAAPIAGATPALAHVNEQVPHGHPHGGEVTLLVDLAAYGGLALAAAAVLGGIVYFRRRGGSRQDR